MSETEILILRNQQAIIQALITSLFDNKGKCRDVDQLWQAFNKTDCFIDEYMNPTNTSEGKRD